MKKLIIEVGGKAYPCRLTMGAMLLFKRNMGKDVSQMQQGDIEEMLMLMWCCMKSASRADGVECEMEFDLFCDMVTPQDMAAWNQALTEGEESKKKEETEP